MVPGPGSLLQLPIPDPALGVPDGTTYVYLPAGYAQQAAAGARYPVVYLIHGYPGGPRNWMINGAAPQTLDALQAGGYAEPMILVSVDAVGPSHGTDWECLNTVGGPQLETYLTDRVTRFIDARFATVTGRDGRAIGGMSSGAFCALNLGLRHQDLYSVIAAIEPFGDPGKPALRLLGGNTAAWVSNAPRLYLPRLSLHRPLTVYLADGSRSGSLANASRLAAEFARAGINPVLQVIGGGGHEWTTARRALPYALHTASAAMNTPTRRSTHAHRQTPPGEQTLIGRRAGRWSERIGAERADGCAGSRSRWPGSLCSCRRRGSVSTFTTRPGSPTSPCRFRPGINGRQASAGR